MVLDRETTTDFLGATRGAESRKAQWAAEEAQKIPPQRVAPLSLEIRSELIDLYIGSKCLLTRTMVRMSANVGKPRHA